MNTKIVLITAFALLASRAVTVHGEGFDGKRDNAVYRVEMHNLTESQWFSPYLCVLHDRRLRLFQIGQAATTE